MWEYLKVKWGVESDRRMAKIFVVFAITGTATSQSGKYIMQLLDIQREAMSAYAYWPLRITLVLVFYNILLLIVGAIFFEFKFFLNFERKMFSRVLPFLKPSE